jgi:hypothetical protein
MRAGGATVGREGGGGMSEGRIFDWELDTPIHEAVGQAIGGASMCWTNPGGAGEFRSETASQIVDELLDLIYQKQLL